MKKKSLIAFLSFCSSVFVAQNSVCFSNPVIQIPTMNNTRGIATGYFNADSIPDIVVTSTGSGAVSMFVGNGKGSYLMTNSFNSGGADQARSATVGDFNLDGFSDVVVCFSQSNSIILYTGNGTGNFVPGPLLNTGSSPFSIASADFNRDAFPDIAVVGTGGGTIAVRLADGLGSFSAQTFFSTNGSGGYDIAVGDFNGDTLPDIVTANSGSGNISILINAGSGGFSPAVTMATAGSAYNVEVTDYNNDNYPDIVAVNNSLSQIDLFTGNGAGGFSSSPIFTGSGTGNFSLTSGHYDADVNIDLAIANNNSGNIYFLSGDGAGGFSAAGTYFVGAGPGISVSADFNLDGYDDFAVAEINGGNFGVLLNHIAKITPAGPTSFCSGGNVELNANPGTGFTYLWTPGASTADSLVADSSGQYKLTVSNVNATCSTSDSIVISEYALPTVMASAYPQAVCAGGYTILKGTGAQTYSWSGGAIDSVPFAITSPASFTVTGTDTHGCAGSDSVFVSLAQPPSQPLCVISVDSATGNHNVVTWEKPADVSMIDSFIIYREILFNNYQEVGAVYRDSLSEFHDYAANPNATGYRYKVGVRDTCGNYGPLSLYHNSIHLQYQGNGNFNWGHYLIENATGVVSAYNFFRDDLSNGNWQVLQVVSGSQNTFTDVNYASFPSSRYRVEVNWGISCNPTRSIVNTSRSNIKNQMVTTSIEQQVFSENFTAFNNLPLQQINFNSRAGIITTLKIYDVSGRLIYNTNEMKTQVIFPYETLAAGIYFYEVGGDHGVRKSGKFLVADR